MTDYDSGSETTGESKVYRTRFGDDETAAEAVVRAVATLTGTPSDDFEVLLYDCLDPDAMNAIVQSESAETTVEISFTFRGLSVTVATDRTVSIREPSTGDGD